MCVIDPHRPARCGGGAHHRCQSWRSAPPRWAHSLVIDHVDTIDATGHDKRKQRSQSATALLRVWQRQLHGRHHKGALSAVWLQRCSTHLALSPTPPRMLANRLFREPKKPLRCACASPLLCTTCRQKTTHSALQHPGVDEKAAWLWSSAIKRCRTPKLDPPVQDRVASRGLCAAQLPLHWEKQ